MSLPTWKAVILDNVQEVLKPAGFLKKGATFIADRGDAVLLVSLQSSSSTSEAKLKATVNLGVFSKTLAETLGVPTTTNSVWDAHWQQRIGFLLPERNDKWWTVGSDAEAREVGAEVADSLRQEALPCLERLASTAALRAHWAEQNPRHRYVRVLDGEDVNAGLPGLTDNLLRKHGLVR